MAIISKAEIKGMSTKDMTSKIKEIKMINAARKGEIPSTSATTATANREARPMRV